MAYTERPSAAPPDWVRPVVVAGLAGALVDAAYFSAKAVIMGMSPAYVLRSIATFWPGPEAMGGGMPSAMIGAATHVVLAVAMAAGFFWARPRVRLLRGSVLTAGLAYGLFLYVVMYLVALPIRWPSLFPQFDGWNGVQDIAAHLAVGITFAWLLRNRAEDGYSAEFSSSEYSVGDQAE